MWRRGHRTIIGAPNECFTFRVCDFVSKPEFLKVNWSQKSRPNLALFHRSTCTKIRERVSEMSESRFQVEVQLDPTSDILWHGSRLHGLRDSTHAFRTPDLPWWRSALWQCSCVQWNNAKLSIEVTRLMKDAKWKQCTKIDLDVFNVHVSKLKCAGSDFWVNLQRL